jgi:hypothetical protein
MRSQAASLGAHRGAPMVPFSSQHFALTATVSVPKWSKRPVAVTVTVLALAQLS